MQSCNVPRWHNESWSNIKIISWIHLEFSVIIKYSFANVFISRINAFLKVSETLFKVSKAFAKKLKCYETGLIILNFLKPVNISFKHIKHV